jgi:hypothetical protein
MIVPNNRKQRLFGFSKKLRDIDATRHKRPIDSINIHSSAGNTTGEDRVVIMVSAAPK